MAIKEHAQRFGKWLGVGALAAYGVYSFGGDFYTPLDNLAEATSTSAAHVYVPRDKHGTLTDVVGRVAHTVDKVTGFNTTAPNWSNGIRGAWDHAGDVKNLGIATALAFAAYQTARRRNP